MRPRISRAEASYLVEVLKAQQSSMKAKQERLKQLDLEVFLLRERFFKGQSYEVMKEGFSDKKKELARLQSESYSIHCCLSMHERLLRKYQAIAEGIRHRGTYKHLSLTQIGVLFPDSNMPSRALS